MANIDVQKLLDTLKEGVTTLALSSAKEYANEAKADGLKLLESIKSDLKVWSVELAEGKMTKEDVEFLVMAKKELIQMDALKQAGLAMIRIDALKNSILQLVVKTISGII